MAKKDPAFLLYSKDWLQGTAQMSFEEKGVYIDLLCHQHQDNGLPTDPKRLARIAHLPEPEFLHIWEFLKSKFVEKDGKLFNKKLLSVTTDRTDHGDMRRVVGTFGRLLRDFSATEIEKNNIRKLFDYKEFIKSDQQNLSKTLSKWLADNLVNIRANGRAKHGNEDGNGNGNGDQLGGVGERDAFVIFDAEQEILGNQKEFERICIATYKTAAQAKESLHDYHLWLIEKDRYPVKRHTVYAGLEKWLRNQKNFTKNGQTTTGTIGKEIEFD